MLATNNIWNSGSRERETNSSLREARYSDGGLRGGLGGGCGWNTIFSFIFGVTAQRDRSSELYIPAMVGGSSLFVNIIAPVALSAGTEIQTVS